MDPGQKRRWGAVFDVDGTLLDSMSIWHQATIRWLARIGRKAEEDLDRVLFPMTIEEGAVYLCERYGLSESPEEVKEGILSLIRDFYEKEVLPKPGAGLFLARLKERGISMALASTNDRELIWPALTRLGLSGYFSFLLTAGETGEGKRGPGLFLEAARRLGTRPEETFVFEDALYAVRAAGQARFLTVGVYDAGSEADQEALRKESQIYLPGLDCWERFLEQAEKNPRLHGFSLDVR